MPAQQPRYSPDEEQRLMSAIWSPMIKNDPEAYVMFVYPWGQKGTPLEKKKGPRAWQRRVLRRIREHIARQGSFTSEDLYEVLQIARVSGRGIGKSALVAWLNNWFRDTHIGSKGLISANTEAQLRQVTWPELSKWVTMGLTAHWWEIGNITITPARWLSELVERDLKKSTRYWATEGKLWSEENPNAYAGPHNEDGMMVTFDEASGIPDGIWSVANGYFTEQTPFRYWFAFSNGRRNSGYFFQCFNSKREFWDHEAIDARDVEETDKKLYQQIINEYGEDSNEARVEVYGMFPTQEESQFIGLGLVEEAEKRDHFKDPSAPIIIGVDPARSGPDYTVIAVRQGRNILSLTRHPDDDTMAIVGHVIRAIHQWNPAMTCIDEGGSGGPVVDRLLEQGYVVRGVIFGEQKTVDKKRHVNKRAEIWDAMRIWLKTASIPKDPRLKTDLTGPKVIPNSIGAIQLEGKKEMRSRGMASPDGPDAIACTFAYPVWIEDDGDDFDDYEEARQRACSPIGGY